MVETKEESDQEANLALLVAALGGGPGDRFDSGVRLTEQHGADSPRGSGELALPRCE